MAGIQRHIGPQCGQVAAQELKVPLALGTQDIRFTLHESLTCMEHTRTKGPGHLHGSSTFFGHHNEGFVLPKSKNHTQYTLNVHANVRTYIYYQYASIYIYIYICSDVLASPNLRQAVVVCNEVAIEKVLTT